MPLALSLPGTLIFRGRNWKERGLRRRGCSLNLKKSKNASTRERWYTGSFWAQTLVAALVGAALTASWLITYLRPVLRKEVELLTLETKIQEQRNTLQQWENERTRAALAAENQEMRLVLAEAESRALERQSLLEKLSGEYNMLAQAHALSEKERSDLVEVAATAGSEVQALQQEIRRLRAAQHAAETRSSRLKDGIFPEWRTIVVTVSEPSGAPLPGIYLDRVVSGTSMTEPIEHSTDVGGRRHVQVRTGDKICTQETDEFPSVCCRIKPYTDVVTFTLERK